MNFGQQPDIRDYEMLRQRLANLDINGAIVQACLSVQQPFFDFASQFGQTQSGQAEKLSKRFEFFTALHRIAFTVYNTAWLSQLHEKPGQLYVLRSAFLTPESPADVEVAIIHHPYNWLEPDNMLAFRTHLEATADIVLSGHQHQAADHRIEASSGAAHYLLEGMAMYDPQSELNGFNVIFVSPAEGLWKVHTFTWVHNRYVEAAPSAWKPFLRNKLIEEHGYANLPKFKEYLADPGVAFTHGRKSQVFLQDIFVYPELHQRDLQRKIEDGKPSTIIIRSNTVTDWIYESRKVLILGDDQSGRTALAKSLYTDLQRKFNLVPLL